MAGTAGTHSRSGHSGVPVIHRRGSALIVAISSSTCIHHIEEIKIQIGRSLAWTGLNPAK